MSTSVYEMNAHEYKTLWYAAAADIEKMQQLIAADEALLRQALEALEEYQQKGAPFLSCDRVANAIRQHLEGKV